MKFDRGHGRNYNVIINDITFQWDCQKNLQNVKKHKVSFEEAASVFFDNNYLEKDDPDHSENEERFLALGLSAKARLLLVCHCIAVSDETVRIISARKATAAEETQYGEQTNAKRI